MLSAIDKIRAAFFDGQLTTTPLDDGSAVLLDLKGERLLALNPTGMHLVRAIEAGARSETELAERLADAFEVGALDAAPDVKRFVEKLSAAIA